MHGYKLLQNDQTCSIKDRTIFENIAVALDAIFVANEQKSPLNGLISNKHLLGIYV